MKNFFYIFLTIFLSTIQSYSQNRTLVDKKYNLSFEVIKNGMPVGWQANGGVNYKFSIDSMIVRHGKYAAVIEFSGEVSRSGVLGMIIRDNFNGKLITLSGYIKTEEVKDGYASLLLRIDPEIGVEQVKVTGTTDWKKFEINLPMYTEKTRNYAIGIMLVGKGKVWFDDLSIAIDGVNIEELPSIDVVYNEKPLSEQNMYPLSKDNEFDNGSKILIDQLSDNKIIDDIYVLGLVWGFLKYHHPNIAKGEYNWDYELFRIMPKIFNSKNKFQRDDTLIEWIKSLGEFSETEIKISADLKVKMMPDLDWIHNSGLSSNLSALLLRVKNAERSDKNYYIGSILAGNFELQNEKQYANMRFPDVGFRLLALYRYWNIIQYFFPYKYIMDDEWKDVLRAFIPKIVDTKNETEFALTVLELIGKTNDSHATLMQSKAIVDFFGEYVASVELSFIENQPIVSRLLFGSFEDGLGLNAGLEIGDIVTKIDNISVAEKIEKLLKYTPASNHSAQLKDIARGLLKTNDSIINVEIIKNGEIFNKKIKAYSMNMLNTPKDTCFKLINDDIAYINNGLLKRKYLPILWEIIRDTKTLIIDNRNYPSDTPLYDFCNYLLPESLPFFTFTYGSISTPGLFSFGEKIYAGRKNEDYYKGQVLILVNEYTQSSAETHTMAYKVHPNALVIGSTTNGSNGNVLSFYLPGGLYTTISGIGIYYPNGSETQRIGIAPDIEIKPTIQGIRNGRDEVLEKAIEIALHQSKRLQDTIF